MSPPKIRKSAGGSMAWTSCAARTDLVDEARVEGFRIEMGVRNPGEFEWRLGGVGDVDRVQQRPPSEGLAYSGGAEQKRLVDEGAPRDL